MGYRSEGKLVIKPKELLKTQMLSIPLPKILREFEHSQTEELGIWEYRGWKMYEGFPEVSEFHSWMDLLDDKGIQYEYVRIGEETTDIEQRGAEVFLYVSRSIEVG